MFAFVLLNILKINFVTKVVLIDSDMLVLKNSDELFDFPEPFGFTDNALSVLDPALLVAKPDLKFYCYVSSLVARGNYSHKHGWYNTGKPLGYKSPGISGIEGILYYAYRTYFRNEVRFVNTEKPVPKPNLSKRVYNFQETGPEPKEVKIVHLGFCNKPVVEIADLPEYCSHWFSLWHKMVFEVQKVGDNLLPLDTFLERLKASTTNAWTNQNKMQYQAEDDEDEEEEEPWLCWLLLCA